MKHTNTKERSSNAGKWVERLDMKFVGKTYDMQFTTRTGEKEKYFMHDMTAKKGISKYGERAVEDMYNEYKQQ